MRSKKIQNRFNLDIIWVLVSSTEDEETISVYKKEGVDIFIEKPLNMIKLNKLINSMELDVQLD